MKEHFLVMTLLVRDEEDILASNIDFHLDQGVNFIIATDNRSVDSTPEILKAYEAKGVLKYIYEGDDDYHQSRWVTRMARQAYSDYAASWVIHSDADEFWWPREGNLPQTFARLASGKNIVKATRTNFVFLGDDSSRTPFYESMIYREKRSLNVAGRQIQPKVAHRARELVTIGQGNHTVQGLDQPQVAENIIEILHFPVRSRRQVENKIVKGGAAYKRNTELPSTAGQAWRRLFQEHQEKGSLDRYCREITFDAERIAHGILEGTLVEDTRLKEYLNHMRV